MKGASKRVLLLLSLALAIGAATSCAPAANPTATPAALPTKAPASGPTAAPASTPAPTTAPTAASASSPAPTTAAATAAPAKAPAEARYAPEVPRITLDELKALIESKANVAILDVRPKESYDLGHIKGAVSYPWKPNLTEVDLEMLPPGDPIVTYCDCGPSEHDSADVAQQLIKLGVPGKVVVLADPSIEGWLAAGYPSE